MSSAFSSSSQPTLAGTPYSIDSDETSNERFRTVRERSIETRQKATSVFERVAREASEVFEGFSFAIRSDLVAESNRLEGYDWTNQQVREVVTLHRELLHAPVHQMLNSLRGDSRVLEALGLYRAHELADDWASHQIRPREYEIRGLHSLIMANHHSAGRYKRAENIIAGARHIPILPGDTPEHMENLAKWWLNGTGDAVLDAAVVHAWLTHIHPFDDGNGRLARLLANMALTQHGYPALIVRSESDRGQYLDALAASDDGDILPLYDLFVSVLRRLVKGMARPTYVQSVIEDRLLSTERQRFALWRKTVEQLERSMTAEAARHGLTLVPQGHLDIESFTLLSESDSSGNGWFLKIKDSEQRAVGLLWFGFRSEELTDLLRDSSNRYSYPSIFYSNRSTDPNDIHPYRPRWRSGISDIPAEISVTPGNARPLVMRWNLDTEEMPLAQGSKELIRTIASELT